MFENLSGSLQTIVIAFLPLLLGIICHEIAHGYVALKLGDPTAKLMGRLTLNPIVHLDVMGSLMFILTSLFTPFVLGWAKPVRVNPRYFKNTKKDMALVALAGPMTNMALALFFAFMFVLFLKFFPLANWYGKQNIIYMFFFEMLQAGIWINIILAWFNLIPIPPLDGSSILYYLLPNKLAETYMSVSRYGFIVVLVLLATGTLGYILYPPIKFSIALINNIINILT